MKPKLTPREQDLYDKCKGLNGFTSREVSDQFDLKVSTVIAILKKIYDKGYFVKVRIGAIRSDGYASAPVHYFQNTPYYRKKAKALQKEYDEEKCGRRRRSLKICQDRGKLRGRIEELEQWQTAARAIHPEIDFDIMSLTP